MKIGEEQRSDMIVMVDNLGLIKLFHDAGINVEKFPDFQVAIRHGMDEGNYIFELGISELFGDCTLIFSEDNEEDDETIERIKELGNFKNKSEYAFIIPLDTFETNLVHLHKVIEVCNKDEKHEHGMFVGDIETKKLYIPLDYVGGFSEIAKKLIFLQNELNKDLSI